MAHIDWQLPRKQGLVVNIIIYVYILFLWLIKLALLSFDVAPPNQALK